MPGTRSRDRSCSKHAPRPHQRSLLGAGLLCGLLLSWTATSPVQAAISVQKHPVVVHRKTFDPASPPKEMPPLAGTEAAETGFGFGCRMAATPRLGPSRKTADGYEADVTVVSLRMTLELTVIIWLPQNVSAKLKAHEEGHRQIAEKVYQNAEPLAKAVGREADGQTFTGHGRTAREAAQAALENGLKDVFHQYQEQTQRKAVRIGDIYDELTAHGTKEEPDETEAIRLAFQRYDQEMKDKQADTAPAR